MSLIVPAGTMDIENKAVFLKVWATFGQELQVEKMVVFVEKKRS